MARIASANADFKAINTPSSEDAYVHPAATRKGPIPMAFQVTSPFNRSTLLMPHALVMHVNPSSFQESYTQKIERFQTRGGFVEQHWGSELTEISADASTGAFMNIYTGLTSILRQKTIAWDRYRDLHDLFYNNGSVYDPYGNIVLQGNVLLMYDRGNYLGTFRTFEMEETDDTPFAFHITWTFKVEKTLLYMAPQFSTGTGPSFQKQNALQGTSPSPAPTTQQLVVPPPAAGFANTQPVVPSPGLVTLSESTFKDIDSFNQINSLTHNPNVLDSFTIDTRPKGRP